MRVLALFLALAIACAAAAEARDGHHSHRGSRGSDSWGTGTTNPWNYPNCLVWSQQIRFWVWVCGPPYPTDMPHT